MDTTTVLVIDENRAAAIATGVALRESGFEVILAEDAVQGLSALRTSELQLIIVDPISKSFDPKRILERARAMTSAPILAYTSSPHCEDRVEHLRAGADVALSRATDMSELLAQVYAMVRRSSQPATADTFDDGLICVDFRARSVAVNQEPVDLTPTEYRLLSALLRSLGSVMSNKELLAEAWNDPSGVAPERVKFGIMRLRRKLGDGAVRVEAVRGFGYRYERRTRAVDRRSSKQRSAMRSENAAG
ncbi:MAG: response regulator transcription factor [Acidimicrobiia bacterium]